METPEAKRARRRVAVTRKTGLHDDHEAFDRENLTVAELAMPDLVFMIGVPPFRIDILTTIDGVEFADAWNRRVEGTFDGIRVWFISRNDLITNKETVARDKDLLDVRRLRDVE